jgi:hypothetical protein
LWRKRCTDFFAAYLLLFDDKGKNRICTIQNMFISGDFGIISFSSGSDANNVFSCLINNERALYFIMAVFFHSSRIRSRYEKEAWYNDDQEEMLPEVYLQSAYWP